MWYSDSAHPALVSLLKFEEQRLGMPVELRVGHLLKVELDSPVQPVIEICIHEDPQLDSFTVLLPDERMEVKAGVFCRRSDDEVGFMEGGLLHPLGSVKGSRLCVFFDLNRLFFHPGLVKRRALDTGELSGSPGNRLAEFLFAQALPKIVGNIRRHDWKGARDSYARRRLQVREQEVTTWKRSVLQNDHTIEERTWQIRSLVEKNRELRDRICSHEKLTRVRVLRKAGDDYDQLLKMVGRGIRSFRVEANALHVLTSSIEIRWEGETYAMGCYWLEIPLGEGNLIIRNEDIGRMVEGYPHPHVNGQGNPCLGNISSTLAQLLGDGELAQVVTLLLEFLRSYNEENPHLRLEKWNPDWGGDEERWDRCYDEANLSDCACCEDYDCPHREGAQERCYNNTETRECIICARCGGHRDAIEDCRSSNTLAECVACDTECPHAGDEDACLQSHDGGDCADCDNDGCSHFQEDDDEAQS